MSTERPLLTVQVQFRGTQNRSFIQIDRLPEADACSAGLHRFECMPVLIEPICGRASQNASSAHSRAAGSRSAELVR
jgi:hypothetical protein